MTYAIIDSKTNAKSTVAKVATDVKGWDSYIGAASAAFMSAMKASFLELPRMSCPTTVAPIKWVRVEPMVGSGVSSEIP